MARKSQSVNQPSATVSPAYNCLVTGPSEKSCSGLSLDPDWDVCETAAWDLQLALHTQIKTFSRVWKAHTLRKSSNRKMMKSLSPCFVALMGQKFLPAAFHSKWRNVCCVAQFRGVTQPRTEHTLLEVWRKLQMNTEPCPRGGSRGGKWESSRVKSKDKRQRPEHFLVKHTVV